MRKMPAGKKFFTIISSLYGPSAGDPEGGRNKRHHSTCFVIPNKATPFFVILNEATPSFLSFRTKR